MEKLFNSITAEESNKNSIFDPSYTLLNVILEYFDKRDKYKNLISDLFHLKNINVEQVNINAQNPVTERTALIISTGYGLFQFVLTLLFWNVDPDALKIHQKTAFHCACIQMHIEIAEYLSPYVIREEFELRTTFNNNTIREDLELR